MTWKSPGELSVGRVRGGGNLSGVNNSIFWAGVGPVLKQRGAEPLGSGDVAY